MDQLVSRHGCGHRLGLFFDFDGTLAPIVEHPSLARLDPATREVLRRLACAPRVAVGVLSGRSLDGLKSLLGMPEVLYAGAAGLELELAGKRIVPRGAARASAILCRARVRLQRVLQGYPGAWLENKGLGLTLHYRKVSSRHIARLRQQSMEAVRMFPRSLRVLEQDMAVEIVPALGWDKGTALRRMLKHAGVRGEDAVYAGNGANDEEAMRAVRDLGGTAVGIGDQAPSFSQYRLAGPAELRRFLAKLARAVEVRSATSRHPKSAGTRFRCDQFQRRSF